MLILKKTYKVEVTIPDEGSFTVEFRRKKQNETLEDIRKASQLEKERELPENKDNPEFQVENLKEMLALLGDSLVGIEGLESEVGKPVTVEDFKNNELYGDIITAILKAKTLYESRGNTPEKKS